MSTTDTPRRVHLHHPDGTTSPLLLVDAPDAGPDQPAVLILPGVGVGARYYLPFARALAVGGIPAAITELKGQGESTYIVERGNPPAGYHETAAQDIPLALDALTAEFGERPVLLLGHSMGAQLGTYHLARRDPRVVGLVAVASQSPYHRGFPAPVGNRLHLGSVLLPTIGRLLGYAPGQFFGANCRIPVDRIRDWATLAARGTMQPARADIDYRAGLQAVTVPVLAVVVPDDDLAPPTAAQGLLDLLPGARTTLEMESRALGHNSWAREPDAVAERVLAWMEREQITPPRA